MEIGYLTDEQIQYGLMKCRDKCRSGDQWPPDLSEFLAMIHGQSDVDYQGAFIRCLEKKPSGRVEKWVFQNYGFNIRSMSHDNGERKHKKFMREAAERDRRGDLVLQEEMLKALPPNSVINTNDVWAKEYESEHGKTLDPRIQKLRAIQGKGKRDEC